MCEILNIHLQKIIYDYGKEKCAGCEKLFHQTEYSISCKCGRYFCENCWEDCCDEMCPIDYCVRSFSEVGYFTEKCDHCRYDNNQLQ